MNKSDARERLINHAFCLMRAIIDEFGAEEGEKMWETISETMPRSVRSQMLMMMITGATMDRIVVKHAKMSANKVHMIKALRATDSRGLGLKEAKEMVDTLTGTGYFKNNSAAAIEVHVNPEDRYKVINELSAVGFVI